VLRRLQVPSIVMKQTMIKKRTIIPIMIPKATTSIYYNYLYYFLTFTLILFSVFLFFFFSFFFFGDSDSLGNRELLKEGDLSLSPLGLKVLSEEAVQQN